MRSGSILPEFSSTIFCCRSKKGTSVGQDVAAGAPLSRPATISAASSAFTPANSVPSGSTATSGPALHSPMQPTPFTSTSLCMPDSSTSFRSASFTRSLCEERHPAAMHTCTRCPYFCCVCCSAAAILRSSSSVMLHTPFDLLHQRGRRDLAQHRAIQHRRRRQAAGTQAARRHQRQPVVPRGLTRLDSVALAYRRQQRRRPLDVAG